jgi:hypothetical protein
MGHGVTGVGGQIQQGQFKLVDVGHHRFDIRGKTRFQYH